MEYSYILKARIRTKRSVSTCKQIAPKIKDIIRKITTKSKTKEPKITVKELGLFFSYVLEHGCPIGLTFDQAMQAAAKYCGGE